MDNLAFIKLDFEIPKHENQLLTATYFIDSIKTKVRKLQTSKSISDKTFIELYDDTVKILDYVGNLSLVAFDVNDRLQLLYLQKYKSSPELAKKLWLDHYDTIHKPYTILKNRCFKILDELDGLYQMCNKKYPPNWKI